MYCNMVWMASDWRRTHNPEQTHVHTEKSHRGLKDINELKITDLAIFPDMIVTLYSGEYLSSQLAKKTILQIRWQMWEIFKGAFRGTEPKWNV